MIGAKDKTMKDSLIATDLNLIQGFLPERCTAKIRSTQQPTDVVITKDGNNVQVKFDDMQKSIAIGQSIVFYDDDILLGGGIISQVL